MFKKMSEREGKNVCLEIPDAKIPRKKGGERTGENVVSTSNESRRKKEMPRTGAASKRRSNFQQDQNNREERQKRMQTRSEMEEMAHKMPL
jgi:hypothetical protein